MENFGLPVGFRFNPTDAEVVNHYLLRKIKGEELPWNDIKDCDLYGDLSPWEIFQRYNLTDENKILYVFTKLKRASRNRISRISGCGTWHGDKRTIEIYDGEEEDDDVIIGLRKTFSFKNNDKRGQWIMHEFSLAGKYFMVKQRCEYVLCRIKKIGKNCLKAEAETVSAAAILQTENYFQAGGYIDYQPQFDAEVDCFAVNKKEEDDMQRLDELNTLLQINYNNNNTDHRQYWNVSTLEKYLMEDDHGQQLPLEGIETSSSRFRSVFSMVQEEEACAAYQYSYTGDWIPPNSWMVEETSNYDHPNYMQQQNYNDQDQVMKLESELVEENEVMLFESADNNEEDWTSMLEEYLESLN